MTDWWWRRTNDSASRWLRHSRCSEGSVTPSGCARGCRFPPARFAERDCRALRRPCWSNTERLAEANKKSSSIPFCTQNFSLLLTTEKHKEMHRMEGNHKRKFWYGEKNFHVWWCFLPDDSREVSSKRSKYRIPSITKSLSKHHSATKTILRELKQKPIEFAYFVSARLSFKDGIEKMKALLKLKTFN